MLETYRQHAAERAALGIPALALSAQQTEGLVELLKNPPQGEEAFLVDLITNRVPPGVDDAAKVKASYLAAVAFGKEQCPLISREKATELLGTMLGGYNIQPLIDLLDDAQVGAIAAEGLKKTLLVFDFFNDVKAKSDAGNANANPGGDHGRRKLRSGRSARGTPRGPRADESRSPCGSRAGGAGRHRNGHMPVPQETGRNRNGSVRSRHPTRHRGG